MILTYKIKHERDFSRELVLARKIAGFALTTKSWSSAQVKHIGLKSIIACQILKKYSHNKTIKKINNANIKLIIPSQGIRIIENNIYAPCLKLTLPIYFDKTFIKINQIEIGKEFAYVCVSYPDAPQIKEINTIGIDRNTTHHSIVASCLETGKILKLGKSCNHIHHKYKYLRKGLQKRGKLKKVKQIKDRESRIVKDINHKVSKALVLFAKKNDACLVMEDLKEIRQTAKMRKKQRYSLHSWSFYQQKAMIEYKAKKYGVSVHYVEPQYTSQRCSRCGHIEQANRKGNIFRCKKCGIVEDSGVNAGFNIASLHQQGIPRFSIESDMLKGSTDAPKEATI
jgi:putative transposase